MTYKEFHKDLCRIEGVDPEYGIKHLTPNEVFRLDSCEPVSWNDTVRLNKKGECE